MIGFYNVLRNHLPGKMTASIRSIRIGHLYGREIFTQNTLEAVSKPPQDDEGAGEADECLEEPRFAFVADEESTEVEEPGEGALDDPATSVAPVLAISFSAREVIPQRSSQIGRLSANGSK